MKAPGRALLNRFVAIVGADNAIRDADAMAAYLTDPRERLVGRTSLVLRPGSVEEVAAILKLADECGTPIVPQGGNTGLVGGQIPSESGDEIVVSLARLDRVRAVDPKGNVLTVEAGVTLAAAREAAQTAGRLLPLSLASEGSCTIGGNLATNAGGTGVLAYGTARALVLGVEVVLASGKVWDGLRKLRKDNTGYDLKHLFVGAEGTLGVITAATLRLFPRPRGTSVAIVAVSNPAAALGFLDVALVRAGAGLVACEIMARICLDAALRHLPGARDPLPDRYSWYVLFEIASSRSQREAETLVATIFSAAADRGYVEDGVRAESLDQAATLWRLRESLSEVQKREGGSIKHDVAVPVAAVPQFLERAKAAVVEVVPGARPFPFGHLGDGSLHFNVSQPPGMDRDAFLARSAEVNAAVHAVVLDLGGTISAEHGIGRVKRDLLAEVKSPVEMDLMRRLKKAFDPNGILNPGRVL